MIQENTVIKWSLQDLEYNTEAVLPDIEWVSNSVKIQNEEIT